MFHPAQKLGRNLLRDDNDDTPSLKIAEPEESRSGLQRTFDLLNIGNYTVMGGLRGLTSGNDISVSQGISEGIKAGLFGGEDNRHTGSKWLGDTGWEPESLGGRFAKGAIGLGLDIALDPVTYIPLAGVIGAGVKGSGKLGMKASHGIPTLQKFAKQSGVKLADNSPQFMMKNFDNIAKQITDATYNKKISSLTKKYKQAGIHLDFTEADRIARYSSKKVDDILLKKLMMQFAYQHKA